MGQNFFRCFVSFTCPKCKRTSSEKLALSSTGSSHAAIAEAISREKLTCNICLEPLLDGTDIDLRIFSSTPEELEREGFKLSL